MARKAWKDLTPAYRARLERAGVTRADHARANLVRARGHQLARPAGAAPAALAEAAARGQLTARQLREVGRSFTWPSWLPKRARRQGEPGVTFPVTPDVAAALSQLPDPKRWREVTFTPRGDGEPWTMTVKLKGNAYDREILIPGGGYAGSGAKEVIEIVTMLTEQSEAKKTRRAAEALFFEVLGSDEAVA